MSDSKRAARCDKEIDACRKLGARLEGIRLDKGSTRSAMSYAMGCSPTTIQNIEIGDSWPSLWFLIKFCRHTSTPIYDLIDIVCSVV